MSPCRIKDKFHLYFQSFHKFCESFENTRENLSLILLGPMRLHIQNKIQSSNQTIIRSKFSGEKDSAKVLVIIIILFLVINICY